MSLTCCSKNIFSKYQNFRKSINLVIYYHSKAETNNDNKKINNHMGQRSTLISEAPADLLIRNLKNDVKPNDVIVEVDSGIGILTKKILNNFDNKLIIFNPSEDLKKDIKNACPKNFSNVIESDKVFHSFYKYYWERFYHANSERHKNFTGTLLAHCSESSNLKIVGTICYLKFFNSLLFDYVFRGTLFYSYLNPTFYIYVPFDIYVRVLKLTSEKSVVKLGTSFLIYFDITLLGTTEKSSFYVKKKIVRNKKKSENYDVANTKFYLLKLAPKDGDVIKEKAGDQLSSFHYFMGKLLRAKGYSNIITEVESIIPGCGEEYIKNGFNKFDRPCNFSEEQWFKAFKILTSHDGFDPSIFLNERTSNKIEEEHQLFYDCNVEDFCDLDCNEDVHLRKEDMNSIYEEDMTMHELYGNYATDAEMDLFTLD